MFFNVAAAVAWTIGTHSSPLFGWMSQPFRSGAPTIFASCGLTVLGTGTDFAGTWSATASPDCARPALGESAMTLYSHKPVGSRRQITSFFVPGDVVDLSTLYLPKPDHAIATLGPAVLAFVPHAALKGVLDKSSTLAQAFWRETLMQTAIFQEWVVNLGRRDASARLAHIVCELIVRLQSVSLARDYWFSVPWTQMDVADACGISNVHANRVIQELWQLELVEWSSRRLKILGLECPDATCRLR
jgi:CRP-like cAMP-binding protein